LDEISRLPSPYKERFLNLIKEYELEVIEPDDAEVETLVRLYMEERIVPSDVEDDARHVACATVLRVDALVSCNLAHLANEWSNKRFNGINLKEGYSAMTIRTPEEVIFYED